MAASFYARYCSGDHHAVWTELRLLGPRVREARYLTDGTATATEVLNRTERNLRRIRDRLGDLGYAFDDPDEVLRSPTDSELALLDELEARYGTFPIFYRSWFERFGSVDFSQSEEQLACEGIAPPPAPFIFGLGSHLVLIVQSLERALDARAQMLAEEVEGGTPESADADGFPILFGSVRSNCEPRGIFLPDPSIDDVTCHLSKEGWFDEDEREQKLRVHFADAYLDENDGFVSELRRSFSWGGFPFWRPALESSGFYSPCEYKPNYAAILPVLQDGLEPI